MLLKQVLLLLQPDHRGAIGDERRIVSIALAEIEIGEADTELLQRVLRGDRLEGSRAEHGIEAWRAFEGSSGAVHPNARHLLFTPDHDSFYGAADDGDHVVIALIRRRGMTEIDAAEDDDLDAGEI